MPKGSVYLVGAGPGNPGLITVRAKELIESCDTLIYDSLVHPAVLALQKEKCEQIFVGKKSGCHSVPQAEIQSLIVAKAREGKRVVRLKGGDPFIFGRGSE